MTNLGDVPGLRTIQTGPFGTQLKAGEYDAEGSGAPVVSVGEIREGFIRIKPETPRVGPEVQSRLSHFMLDERDVVVSRKGAVDRSAWISKSYGPLFLGSDAIAVRFNDPRTARFYSYALQDRTVREWLVRHAPGTTMLSMNGAVLGAVPVPRFASDQMDAAVGLLGALDDKIAENNSVAARSDELFHLVWRKFYRSLEGSTQVRLREVAPTQYGLTSSADKSPNGPRFLRVTDINKLNWIDWDSVPFATVDEAELAKYLLSPGDLLVARMADPGAAAIFEGGVESAVFASYLVRLKPSTYAWGLYVFGYLKSRYFLEYADSVITGTAQRNMNATLIGDASIRMPSEVRVVRFAQDVHLLRRRISSSLKENLHLAATRDELLPLLMSGKITVKAAEKTLEEVV